MTKGKRAHLKGLSPKFHTQLWFSARLAAGKRPSPTSKPSKAYGHYTCAMEKAYSRNSSIPTTHLIVDLAVDGEAHLQLVEVKEAADDNAIFPRRAAAKS